MTVDKDKEWWIKFISVTVIIVSVVILIILKQRKPDMNLKTPIYIVGTLAVFSIVGFFSKQIKGLANANTEKEKVMSKEDIYKKILDYSYNQRHNNLAITNPIQLFKTDTIGNDIIYAIRVKLNLDNEEYIMIINASFEGREPVYLDSNATSEEIESEMNKIARKPKLDKVNETVSENSLTGTKITTRSTMPLEEEKEKESAI